MIAPRERGRRPPRLARALVRRLVRADQAEFVLADLDDDHAETSARRGSFAAGWRYWRLAIASVLARWTREPAPAGRPAVLASVRHDARYATRMLRRNPGFAALTILTLAVGIGANTAIFSVLNGVLLRPLPYERPDAIVNVWQVFREWQRSDVAAFRARAERFRVSWPAYREWRARSRTLEHLAAYTGGAARVVERADAAEWVAAVEATATLPVVLGVAPAQGRWFRADEDVPGGPQVAVVSHGFAQRWFGDQPPLGQRIRLSGAPYEVVGVMPPEFYFPGREHGIWIPITDERRNDRFTSQSLEVVGRLRDGIPLTAAQREMSAIADQIMADVPEAIDAGVRLVSRVDEVAGDTGRTLVLLMLAVGLVLAVATANVAALLMVRAAARQQEVALRLALGASRIRVSGQMLTEGAVLAFAGGVAGLIVLFATFGGVRALLPASMPRLADIVIDWRVFLFALGASAAVAVVFGLSSAAQALRHRTRLDVREDGLRSVGRQRSRSALVVLEMAVSVVLLTAAVLLVQSYVRLQAVERGFDARGVLTARVTAPMALWSDAARLRTFFAATLARAGALPGVTAAGVVSTLPLSGGQSSGSFGLIESPQVEADVGWSLEQRATSGYFGAMGIPLKRGRLFGPEDVATAPRVVVINERFARQYYPDRDPIGQVIWEEEVPHVIVGVVGNVKHAGLAEEIERKRYWAFTQSPDVRMDLVMRTDGDPGTLAAPLRRAILDIEPLAVVGSTATMDRLVAAATALPRFRTLLLGLLAASAMVLAAMGIYGVIAFTVASRTREIGVRMSLGARGTDVLRQVVGSGLQLIAPGLVLGVLAAFLTTRSLERYLYETSATDPLTFAGVALGAGLLALVATVVPARRASRVDPLVALRSD